MATVEYVPYDEPRDLGWVYQDHKPVARRFLYGYYKVRLDDGWTLLSPHAAQEHTVSVDPVDMDLNPEWVEFMIQRAEQSRS